MDASPVTERELSRQEDLRQEALRSLLEINGFASELKYSKSGKHGMGRRLYRTRDM